MWPKLFRRIVPYLAAGFVDFNGFDAWLRADPVNRDDEVFLLDRLERGNLHDVIRGVGQTIQLTVWPEDFVISPDPAPPGGGGGGAPSAAGDVLIVAALPDPVGTDAGRELVTVLNTTSAAIDLTGWAIADATGRNRVLSGSLAAGVALAVVMQGVQLANAGDTLALLDAQAQIIDQVAYQGNQVRAGRTICFGR